MSQRLIDRSNDLQLLQNEGFTIEIANGFIAIHDIPYVTSSKDIMYASLISQLTLKGDVTVRPNPHTIYFTGEYPCNNDGSPITSIRHSSPNKTLFGSEIAKYMFSNKPDRGYYNDYFEKFMTYIKIISSPAISLDNTVKISKFKPVVDSVNSVHEYMDTNSSRANIVCINEKLAGQKIGIIGLGGTGSYVLDLVAKTPVSQIHLFDGDLFLQHNAFRAPGAPNLDTLEQQLFKCEYLRLIYSSMHKGIITHNHFIDTEHLVDLDKLDHIFICIDNGGSKKEIVEYLCKKNKSFTDLGIGVDIVNNSLQGTLRSTTALEGNYDHLPQRISYSDNGNDEYSSNIQIADLNALNAIMGVIQWKKKLGFYNTDIPALSTLYLTNTEVTIDENIA
jgi:hypothetical protein